MVSRSHHAQPAHLSGSVLVGSCKVWPVTNTVTVCMSGATALTVSS
jgi:hypothetical protein